MTSVERIAPSSDPADDAERRDERARSRRCVRIVDGDAPCASRSNSSPRSSRTSPTTTSTRPTSARRSATAAVPASVSSAPRASGSDCSRASVSARDATVSSGARGGVGPDPELVRRPEARRARVEQRRGLGRSATTASPTIDGKRCTIPTIRARSARPRLRAGSRRRGPAASATAGSRAPAAACRRSAARGR